MVPLQKFINDFHSRYRTLDDGQLASYIPELTKADARWFGISIVTTDGQIFEVGDTQQNFTIQSISKAFAYGLANRSVQLTLDRIFPEDVSSKNW